MQTIGKNGQTVEIFQDPITRKKYEGVATLVRPTGLADSGIEEWEVVFEGDDEPVTRKISFII